MTDAAIADDARAIATRNARCACGSGLRLKHCCGRAGSPPPKRDALGAMLAAAFDAHRHGRLDESRTLYRRILRDAPGLPDAEHMLGVVELCEGDLAGALATLRRTAARQTPAPPEVVFNLAVVVAGLLAPTLPPESADLWLRYLAERPAAPCRPEARTERVSVVVPSHNHAAYVGAALESALAQTRAPDEIVVVDDGSTDGSSARLHAMAARAGGRIRLLARERRGAPATIDDAVARCTGDWIAILNSDDRYAPEHLASMIESIAVRGASWGFARPSFVDETAAGDREHPGPVRRLVTSELADAPKRTDHRLVDHAVGVPCPLGARVRDELVRHQVEEMSEGPRRILPCGVEHDPEFRASTIASHSCDLGHIPHVLHPIQDKNR
jgi:hypothetical protein